MIDLVGLFKKYLGNGTGTVLATNKSLIDTLLLDVNLDHLIQTASTCKASCTTNLLQTNLTEATDDHYNGLCLLFTSGSLAGQTSIITDYNGTTKEVTVDPSLIEVPANTDAFVILGVGVGRLKTCSKGLEQIYDLIDSMNKTKRVGDTTTTDGTEQTLWIYDAPSSNIEPFKLMLDTTAHTSGETVVITVYHRLKSGGSYITFETTTLAGAQVPAGICFDLCPNLYGIKITINKTGGTNRAYDWEVWYRER